MNREEWLQDAVEALTPVFTYAKLEIPRNLMVSCGFPSSGGVKNGTFTTGECWYTRNTADKHIHIFINPRLGDEFAVLHTLAHEILHAIIDDPDVGHRGKFRRLAIRLGLTGKMTATVPGPILEQQIRDVMAGLPPYPNDKLTPIWKEKKEGQNRHIKYSCDQCGWIGRTSKKFAKVGLPPACICGGIFELEDPSLLEEENDDQE